MRSDQVPFKPSPVGLALLMISLAAGAGLSALLNNGAPMVVFGLAGFYLLFAIRMADQWEKVAVLRMGRYIGLRGPGLFHVIPVVDRLSRSVAIDAEARALYVNEDPNVGVTTVLRAGVRFSI